MVHIPKRLEKHKRTRNLLILLSLAMTALTPLTGHPGWAVSGLTFLNLYSFLLMGWDKRSARRNEAFRIPETTFYLLALSNASLGIALGMTVFRHKTWHRSFRWIPLFIPFQGVLIYWLFK